MQRGVKKLIMGFGTNQTRESLEVFFRSAREVWPASEADIVLVADSLAGIGDILAENDADFFATTNAWSPSTSKITRYVNRFFMQCMMLLSKTKLVESEKFTAGYFSILETLLHPHFARWFSYRRMLKIFQNYDKILLADVRDVYFQADAFANLPPEGVKVFEDGGGFAPSTVNAQWYRTAYGKSNYEKFRNRTPICIGVIAGDAGAMRRMIDKFSIKIAQSPFGKVEQAVFNHYLFTGLFGDDVVHLPNIVHGIAHLADVEEYKANVRLEQDMICFPDGKPIPVVHMYDRHPDAHKLVIDRYGVSA